MARQSCLPFESVLEIAQPIAAARDVEDAGTVRQPIEDRRGRRLVADQRFGPVADAPVGGEEHAAAADPWAGARDCAIRCLEIRSRSGHASKHSHLMQALASEPHFSSLSTSTALTMRSSAASLGTEEGKAGLPVEGPPYEG